MKSDQVSHLQGLELNCRSSHNRYILLDSDRLTLTFQYDDARPNTHTETPVQILLICNDPWAGNCLKWITSYSIILTQRSPKCTIHLVSWSPFKQQNQNENLLVIYISNANKLNECLRNRMVNIWYIVHGTLGLLSAVWVDLGRELLKEIISKNKTF